MDPRLRAAVDASVGWYDDLCSLHGSGSRLTDGLWSALGAPPPLHSDAVVVEPGVTVQQVGARLETRDHAGVKDSFGTLDLSALAMHELFAASWMYRPATSSNVTDGVGWTCVSDEAGLAVWTSHHDTADVLLPGLLRQAHFKILARSEGGQLTAGAVARLGSGVVDVSNVWAASPAGIDWPGLVAAIATWLPGRPLVGYERGEPLRAAVEAGFRRVGDLRVWAR